VLSSILSGESLKLSELHDAIMQHMSCLVLTEKRLFSHRDFVSFKIDGKEYGIIHGTFRNKVSKFVKSGIVELEYRSTLAFYTIKGVNFGKIKNTRDENDNDDDI
jgi:hypothetical protein